MNSHRFKLEPYKSMKSRYVCPSCSKSEKTFTRYIDSVTGEHLHLSVGRCNRESNCGYHYKPKQYFQDNAISPNTPQPTANRPKLVVPQSKLDSFIPVDAFKASLSLSAIETNHFVRYLTTVFNEEITSDLVSRYFIGTSKHWPGATVFWQIDTSGKLRTGKIMLYRPDTGKRVKNLDLAVYWVHKALKLPEFELRQCLFGEHLLLDKTKPVAIVESEKTAVIASMYLPQFIWVAVGSLSNLNERKCEVLKGRTVILFPDLNGFEKWSKKANDLANIATFTVSDLLERSATEAERLKGLDLADYLTKLSLADFTRIAATTKHTTAEVVLVEQAEPDTDTSIMAGNASTDWSESIPELVNYYQDATLPNGPVRLNPCSTVTNIPLFVESHLANVQAYKENPTFLPYLERLQQLKNILTQ